MRSRSRQATVPDKLSEFGEKDTLAWRGLIAACIVRKKGPDFARNQDLFCAAAINVLKISACGSERGGQYGEQSQMGDMCMAPYEGRTTGNRHHAAMLK